MDGTASGYLRHWSTTDPQRIAYIFRSDKPGNDRLTLTRRETFTLAARYAAVLRDKGIRPGDVVCNTLANSPERLITDLGVMLAGAAVLNGMVFLIDGTALVRSMATCRAVAIITDTVQPSNALTLLTDHLRHQPVHGQLDCPDAPLLKHLLCVDCGRNCEGGLKPFLEQLKEKEEEFVAETKPCDLAYIMTTSGSTGFSKLVPRTHASFLALGENTRTAFGIRSDDVLFNDRSQGWVAGSYFFFLVCGITRVLIDLTTQSHDPMALVWRAIVQEQCTRILMVPLHIDLSLGRPDLWKDLKTKIRVMVTGGQPVGRHHTKVLGRVSDSLIVMYGSTECGYVTTCNVCSDDINSYQDGDSGLPVDGCQIKLLDEDGQEIHQADQAGEVLIKSPILFTGYLGVDEAVNSEYFTEDGWFHSTDVGIYDSRGHLHIICRKSNAIMRGVFTLYPGWLEVRIQKCPGIGSVIIVPIPDPTLYQELCACIVPKPGVQITAEEVRQFCKGLFAVPDTAELSMVPRYYVFFDSLPTTTTGKLDRKAIRRAALHKLGIEDSFMPTSQGSQS